MKYLDIKRTIRNMVDDLATDLPDVSNAIDDLQTQLTDHMNTGTHDAEEINVNAGGFGGILDGSDDDAQTALVTIDMHLHDDRYYTESEIDTLEDKLEARSWYFA